MPHPLTRHEDRRADVKAEGVMLVRGSVSFPHQEADQPFVRGVHLGLVAREADASAVHHG